MNREKLAAIAADRGLVGGPFGSSLVNADYTAEGVPVIRGANMSDGRFIGGEFAFVSPEKFARDLARNSAVAGDVIYTQRGTLGQVALVPSGGAETFVVSQSQMRLRVDPERAVPQFVYYASTTSDFLKQIDDRSISTGVPHTNLGILADLEIPLPPMAEQQAIAEVLGALDDKIAANNGLAGAADALIRAEYLSLVNQRRVRVGEVASSPRSGVDPTKIDPRTTYVGLEHIPRRSMWIDATGSASEVTSGKSEFAQGDILFGKLRPYFHKVAAAPSNGVCSTDILVVRASSPRDSSLLLAALSSDEVVESVIAASEGTRMPRTSWKDLAAAEINWPADDHIPAIALRLDAIRSSAQVALSENQTLAVMRDALLPLLMSGRLSVRDAEAAASVAGA